MALGRVAVVGMFQGVVRCEHYRAVDQHVRLYDALVFERYCVRLRELRRRFASLA